jgi:ubiquinone/menaquinone biosynthesis C-methylase UbiE
VDDVEQARHTERIAGVFDRSADTYDHVGVPYFGPIAERLVRSVVPALGDRALDLGCGRGAALFPLAEAVGRCGWVTGIDLAPNMVEATRSDVERRGLHQVEVRLMNACDPALDPRSYDVAVASVVLFFMPDPVAALRAWRDLLVPGGRLAISTLGNRDSNWDHVNDAFRPYLSAALGDALDGVAADLFAGDASVAELMAEAGYGDIESSSFEIEAAFADSEHWHEWSWSHGQRAMWEAVPEALRDLVRDEAAARLECCRESDGVIRLHQPVWITVAKSLA